MLPLEDFSATDYKTAARINIIHPNYVFVWFAVFDFEIALKSQRANETPSSNRAWEPQNMYYSVGFVNNCDVDAKLTISCKCFRI